MAVCPGSQSYTLHRCVDSLTFKRQKRMKQLGAAEQLFKDMDLDGSGIITRDGLRSSLKQLGMEVSEENVRISIPFK